MSELDQKPPEPGAPPSDADFADQAKIEAEIEAERRAADEQQTLTERPESARTPDRADLGQDAARA